MRLQRWAPLSVLLLLAPLAVGNIRLHHPAHKQPDKVDPRNHYYLEAKLPLAAQANSTSVSSVASANATSSASVLSANATKTIHGRDTPISTTAGGSLPTTSTGALRCGPDFPCLDGGCCGANNLCGFGPSYCGTGCQNGCNATAPCGRDSAGGAVSCGMNLCCSYYGWCGVDATYCTPPPKRGAEGCQVEYSDCRTHAPLQCDPLQASATKRTIAYYQGGNIYPDSRACDQAAPSDLKTDNYTHLYWAFAVIDSSSHQLIPSDQRDVSLYSAFTNLKKAGKLETWISVGGFDFVTANPNAWSNMVGTAASRAAFIKSAVSFMDIHGFQGIDLDWEYPVDPKRGGQPKDMANLVQLLADMRADPTFGQKYGISVTLAPDIWYLQHFDAKGLLKYASWLGFMAYDLHGIWDANVPRVGRKVYGHTNINDISRDLIPMWYDLNAADMSRVNLGVALYGRGYTLQDPNCNKADGSCNWIAGNTPGACTGEEGILSRAEINQIIKDKHLTPTNLDDGTGFTLMKQITWDDQWIGYDDEETLTQKTYYASSHCFGGTMAWSIDLGTDFVDSTGDDGSGDTSPFPGKAAGAKCHWSACGFPPTCPSGTTSITFREGQCDNDQELATQAYCCPDDTPLHDCKWRGDSGDCSQSDGTCGDCQNTQCQMGEQFVTSDVQGDAQWSCPGPASPKYGPERSLCCQYTDPTVGNAHSLIAPPQCDLEGSGSLYQSCQDYARGLLRERQAGYCQNDNPGPNGCTLHSYQACDFEICGTNQGTVYNCGLMGLALQELVTNCSRSTGYVGGTVLLRASGGDGHSDQTLRLLNINSSRKRDFKKRWSNVTDLFPRQGPPTISFPPNRTLPNGSPFGLSFAAKMGQPNSVNTQDSVENQKTIAVNLAQGARANSRSIDIVDRLTASKAIRLTINLIQGGLYMRDLLDQLPLIIQGANDYRNDLGNPSSFGMSLVKRPYYDTYDYVGIITLQNDDDPEEIDLPPDPELQCQGQDLCDAGVILCDEEAIGDFDSDQPPSKRSVLANLDQEIWDVTIGALEARRPYKASGSRSPYEFRCDFPNKTGYRYLNYKALTYPTCSQWTKDDPRYKAAYDVQFNNFCTSLAIDQFQFPLPNKRKIVTEHIFELQTPKQFFEDVTKNLFMDGSQGSLTDFPGCDYFYTMYTNSLANLNNPPSIPKGYSSNEFTPMERIKKLLGSQINYEDFVFLERNINGIKTQMWQYNDPVAATKVRNLLADDAQHTKLLTSIRSVFNVVSYLNYKQVNDILIENCNAFRKELIYIDYAWEQAGHPKTELVEFWDEWVKQFFTKMGSNAQRWTYAQIYALRAIWTPRTTPQDKAMRNMVLNTCSAYDAKIATQLTINIAGLDTSPY